MFSPESEDSHKYGYDIHRFMSVHDRLKRGEWFCSKDPDAEEYFDSIRECFKKVTELNTSVPTMGELHSRLSHILGYELDESDVIVPPIRCDFGFNIIIGRNVIINYNCTFLDTVTITIGDDTMIGPNCQLVTAVHPADPEQRRDHRVMGKPITIGRNCWLGAGVTVLPGITIGDDCIIGAGSVVTHDVPDGMTVAGNPARPIPHRD